MAIIYDKAIIDHVDTLPNGSKLVRSRVARTGIQKYLRRELGDAVPMGDPNDVFSIYRPADQVFSDSSVNGWAHVPVTLEHPSELVTTDNMASHSVGHVTPRAKIDDDGWFWLEAVIDTAKAISALDSGTHKEWSGGYTAVMDMTPGVTPDGQKYDGVQTNIAPNHLAMVPSGRANQGINDSAINWDVSPLTKEVSMTLTTIMLGDKAVKVADADAPTVAAILADHQAVLDAKDAKLGEVESKLVDAEAKILTDEQMAEKVKEFADAQMKRQVVVDARGEDFVKDKPQAWIDGAYANIMEDAPAGKDKAPKALGDKVSVSDSDPWGTFKKGYK